mgnify:FL=1
MFRFREPSEPMSGTDSQPHRDAPQAIMPCPIRLDPIHCSSCYFEQGGCRFKEWHDHLEKTGCIFGLNTCEPTREGCEECVQGFNEKMRGEAG